MRFIKSMFIISGMVVLLVGCGGTSIKQNIYAAHDYEYCIQRYDIQTVIFNNDWMGFVEECIYAKYVWDVPLNQRDSISKAEYTKAEIFEKKVNECFNDL